MADLRSLIFSVGFKGSTSGIDKMNTSMDKLKGGMGSLDKKTKESGDKFKTSFDSGAGSIDMLAGKVIEFGGVVAGVFGAGKLLNMADTYQMTTSRLNLMNDGLQTTDELQKKIVDSALNTHSAYQDTVDSVARLGITTGKTFSSNDEILSFVEQLNKQFKIAGTTTEGQSSAMLQLTQAMASGALRGDELNSIYENAPTLIKSMADYMGVPVEQMRSLAEEGKITTDVIKNGILGASEETNKQFESMGVTFGQSWIDFKTRATESFKGVSEKLNELSNSQGFKDMVDKMVGAIDMAAPIIANMAQGLVDAFNSDKLKGFVDILGLLATMILPELQKNMPAIVGIAAAITAWSVATSVMTAAQWLLNAALAANPIGVIILAIVALVAATMYAWNTNEEFRNAIIAIWEGIKGAFITAGEAIQTAWSAVAGFFQSVWDNISTTWGQAVSFFQGVVSGIQAVFSGISQFIIDAFNGAVTFLQELPAKALEWAGDMMQGFIDGIKNGITAVGDAIKGVADKITSFLHFSRPDEGPLRQYETWMPDMMQGLASGITNNVGLVKEALSGMTGSMSAKVTGEVSGTTETSASGGGGVMNFSPQITVNVNGGGQVNESFSSIEKQLNLFMDEYAKKMALRNPKVAY